MNAFESSPSERINSNNTNTQLDLIKQNSLTQVNPFDANDDSSTHNIFQTSNQNQGFNYFQISKTSENNDEEDSDDESD